MPLNSATETDVVVLTAPAAVAADPQPDEVEYPERRWTAQSIAHGEAVMQAAAALRQHFDDRQKVLVAMELAVSYQRGNDKVWLQPDVQVVFAVNSENRSSFRVWEEGKAPDFVLEVASPSTAENDAKHKAQEYARIGVREYWRLDPQGGWMACALEGYEARGGRYDPVQPVLHSEGGQHLRSRVLGLELRSQRQAGATVVVFRDPDTGEEFDGALSATEQRRRAAEDRASAAEDRASVAEDRASVAEERVRALEKRLQNLASYGPPLEREP